MTPAMDARMRACLDLCLACDTAGIEAVGQKVWGADGEMARWVEACRRCAEACRELAGRPGTRRRATRPKAIRSTRRWTPAPPKRFARA